MTDQTDARPPSMAEMMTALVGWMAALDKLAISVAHDKGRPELAPNGRGISEDLEVLAAWFDKHPDVDQMIHQQCFSQPHSTEPATS